MDKTKTLGELGIVSLVLCAFPNRSYFRTTHEVKVNSQLPKDWSAGEKGGQHGIHRCSEISNSETNSPADINLLITKEHYRIEVTGDLKDICKSLDIEHIGDER